MHIGPVAVDWRPWDLSPREAIQVQNELRQRIVLQWDDRPVATVAGADVSVSRDVARAAVVVLSLPELSPVAAATAEGTLTFPYIPGLLSFREAPAILAAWHKLPVKPDLILFDGQGIAHPRGFGIASHIGLWLKRPTIGVAKSRLFGHAGEPGTLKGDWAPLYDEQAPDRVIGAALRTRAGTRPVFVSPGHLIDLSTSLRMVLACTTRYRLPETTRWAHRVAGGAALPPPDQ